MRTLTMAGLLLAASVLFTAAPTPAEAQATCRNACMSEENACLQRTSNKSQCGGKSQTCMEKCK